MKAISEMSKDERSLLLFFETCLVDSHGKIDGRKMNLDDMHIAKGWNRDGFVEFGRLPGKWVFGAGQAYNQTHYVVFSEEAWELAHEERRARAARNRQHLDAILALLEGSEN